MQTNIKNQLGFISDISLSAEEKNKKLLLIIKNLDSEIMKEKQNKNNIIVVYKDLLCNYDKIQRDLALV